MKYTFKYRYLLLLLILVVGAALRFYKLGSIPWAVNRDEASIGYTAYSLLKIGTDEHGVSWPLNIQSFGDWKLPVYIYTLIPFVSLFGLTTTVVRLPSALAGVLLIPATFYFVTSFSSKKKHEAFVQIGLLAAFLVAISPWSIRLSRIAYEANLALLLCVTGVSLLIRGLTTKNKLLLLPGTFLTLLPLITYHAYQVFIPIFLLSICILFFAPIAKTIKEHTKIALPVIFIALAFMAVLFSANTGAANTTKFTGLSIFSESTYHYELYDRRISFPNPNGIAAKIYANSVSMVLEGMGKNIASILSPSFLLFNGGTHGSHDIAGIGNIYSVTLTGLFLFFFWYIHGHPLIKNSKMPAVLLLWLLFSFFAPIITTEAAHSIRFSPALFPLELLAALGLYFTITSIRKINTKIVVLGFFLILITYSVIQFFGTYFYLYPKRDYDTWPWYYHSLAQDISLEKNEYKKVLFPQVSSSPYIFLLLEWQYPPENLATRLSFYPVDEDGFVHAKQLENIYFEPVDWQAFISSAEPLLVFIDENELKKQNLSDNDFVVIKKYESKDAKKAYYLVSNR